MTEPATSAAVLVFGAAESAPELLWASAAAAGLADAARAPELVAAVRVCCAEPSAGSRHEAVVAGQPALVTSLPGGLAVVELAVEERPARNGATAPHAATLLKLASRVAQQRAVADLGSLALQTMDTATLLERAVAVVAEVLDIEVVTVLEGVPEGLRTVAGNDEASVIGAVLSADGPPSQAGLTVLTGETVVSTDVLADERFVWALDGCHDSLVGGVTTLIGDVGAPWGVLSAHSLQPRDYDPDDQHFLVGVANVVAAAVARNAFEAQNRWAALHDALTGLPNRASLNERLTHALARDRRTGACTAVLLLDLDGFKYVNDSLGHEAGDALLVTLAPLLAAAVRPSDMVARLGGDEFVMVCEDLPGGAEALAIAERVRALWGRPLTVRGAEVFVQGSIGVAVVRAGLSEAHTLLSEADAAMYSAKSHSVGGVALFDQDLRWRAASRLQMETALRRALAREELHLEYQPVVDVLSGRPVGVEALARWRLASGETVSPARFIPVAEECGVIQQLGDWVLREAVRTFASWERRHDCSEPRTLTVNVSGRQLARPGFAEMVLAILAEEGLPPAQLGLEITESVVLQEPAGARTALVRLRDAGLGVLLDDFGTGYSSLSWLRQLPANALKIDRSFVAGLVHDPADASVVEALVALGRSLGLTVVAEGVEDGEQLAALRRLGCPRAQGFYFARPLVAADAEAYLSCVSTGPGV